MTSLHASATVVMLHPFEQLEGAKLVGHGLYLGGIAAAKQAVADGSIPAESFKFFFNHLRMTSVDLQNMLGGGGWMALMLPGDEHAAVSLKNSDDEVWRSLSSRVRLQIKKKKQALEAANKLWEAEPADSKHDNSP